MLSWVLGTCDMFMHNKPIVSRLIPILIAKAYIATKLYLMISLYRGTPWVRYKAFDI